MKGLNRRQVLAALRRLGELAREQSLELELALRESAVAMIHRLIQEEASPHAGEKP